MNDDGNINQRRHDRRQLDQALDSARGYGPGKNDLFAWGFIVGRGLGLFLAHTLEGVLLWAFGGLAISFVLRLLANLLSRNEAVKIHGFLRPTMASSSTGKQFT
jgi:hypothetical protein